MFRSLHPSETSGGGLDVIQAKYRYKTDRPEEPNRCMFCGFINDLSVVASGDAYDGVGMSYGALQVTTFNMPVPYGAKPITMTINTIEPTPIGGCALCGSLNQRGALVGSSFGSGIDLSNL